MSAYNRGDYVPAIRVFRALAEQGNAKAQNVLGVMFRKGEGVPKNPVRAHMWFSVAAKRGDAKRQGRAARDVANHDGAGNFAGRSNGESVRGVELPGLRVLNWCLMVRSASSRVSNHESVWPSFETRSSDRSSDNGEAVTRVRPNVALAPGPLYKNKNLWEAEVRANRSPAAERHALLC